MMVSVTMVVLVNSAISPSEFETYGLHIDDRPISSNPDSTRRARYAGTASNVFAALGGFLQRSLRKDKYWNYRSELHWRLSKIAILPVLMLLALALGYGGQGQNRVLMMVSALMTYFAYANLGGYLVALSRRGHSEPLSLLWVLHFLVALTRTLPFPTSGTKPGIIRQQS